MNPCLQQKKYLLSFSLVIIILFSCNKTTEKISSIKCNNCNLIVVSIDTLRADHLPCYGYHRQTAPSICKIASKGILFENFISQSVLTPISQMSIFTSQYPSSNGYQTFLSNGMIPSSNSYLPAILKKNGYKTATFGSSFELMTDDKEHLQTFRNNSANPQISFSKGFDLFKFIGYRNNPVDSLSWIKSNKDKKFFLWLPIGALHFPYGTVGNLEDINMYVSPSYKGVFDKYNLEEKWNYLSMYTYGDYLYLGPQGKKVKLNKDDKDVILARYDYGIKYVDNFIERLWEKLEDNGLLENTIVVIHGIHGEDLGEHGYYIHYDIFDTEVKNVFIIFNPKDKRSKISIKDQTRGIDLPPTVLDLLGMKMSNAFQGTSLLPLIRETTKSLGLLSYMERRPLLEEVIQHCKTTGCNVVPEATSNFSKIVKKYSNEVPCGDIGLRTNKYKLIHRKCKKIEEKISWWKYISKSFPKRQEFELYDLVNDPTEQLNVIKKFPEIARRLKKKLLEWEKKHIKY